jgi:hypothetical protein
MECHEKLRLTRSYATEEKLSREAISRSAGQKNPAFYET